MSLLNFSLFYLIYYCFQQPLYKLKVFNLKGSENLIKTPRGFEQLWKGNIIKSNLLLFSATRVFGRA